MRVTVLVPLVALLCALVVSPMEGHTTSSADSRPTALVEWESGESAERLSRSSHKMDFFPLSNHFISQDNSMFFGPVSSAIALNALRLGRKDGLPKDRQTIAEDEIPWLPQGADPFYGKYTPNNVLNDRTKMRIEVLGKPILIEGDSRSDFGPQLRQVAQVLRSHGLRVVTRIVDAGADAAAIRREIAANLASGDDYVLVNYARRALGQEGGGHISPLGAYDERSDSFLIMDVNPNRAPWVWVRSHHVARQPPAAPCRAATIATHVVQDARMALGCDLCRRRARDPRYRCAAAEGVEGDCPAPRFDAAPRGTVPESVAATLIERVECGAAWA